MEFIGFPRPDGSIGIRNHVIILGLGLSGAQIVASPVEKGRCMAHALIPAINFFVDQDTGRRETCDLDLSRVKDGQLAVENAGLLLLSEILATASGKLTREKILRDIVIAT